ncbi:hypothetical protein E1265_02150 [Streptomyces sp. 8K308]|uniref:hypothetical protein n=1 Tax=Streptomyces sp. 8K308 TaxID=2530388 RepID=UPI00105268EC|nr:hypothetical protein [Streptomyces sp. 8K308]TDC27313.1 hypothetical protein E1265_02150 [Streptomyces sp. 8K308]
MSTRDVARDVETADSMALWSFVCGLVGLLVFNIVLGPLALELGALALTGGTGRPGRALAGAALGAADLALLAALAANDSTISWHLAA